MSAPRVRFAPAPSGSLHVGSLRTALFNHLHAAAHDGTFLLRIEDTDAARATTESMVSMLQALAWVGITPDEGVVLDEDGEVAERGAYGPYRQSRRAELHAAVARRLEESGHLYRDERTPEQLQAWREQRRQAGLPPVVSRGTTPAPVGDGRPATLRFALPEHGTITVDDLVRGEVSWEWAAESDPVLVRSDGSVTYPLANTVDDVAQGITLVCRGEDLLSVTPRQVVIAAALLEDGLLDDALAEVCLSPREAGWGAPEEFAHLSMVVGTDRKKLSKRHGAVSIQALRRLGFLPETVLNATALLGWSPGDGTERMDRDELVERFDLRRVTRAAAAYDEDKLTAFNGERIRQLEPGELAERLMPYLDGTLDAEVEGDAPPEPVAPLLDAPPTAAQHEVLEGLAPLVQERMQRLDEIRVYAPPFLVTELAVDATAAEKVFRKAGAVAALEQARAALAEVEWEVAPIEEALRGVAEDLDVGFGKVAQPVRVAVTGSSVSPPLFESLALLGRDVSLARIDAALPLARAVADAA